MRPTLVSFVFGLLILVLPGLARAACSVELNSATLAQLQTLPGIGPAKAAAILDHRTQIGAFATVEALDDVPGIGPATMANLRPMICVSGEATPASTLTTVTTPPSNDPLPLGGTSAGTGTVVDINSASAAQLETLPGIGPAKSAAIIAHRTDVGPFGSCNDLTRVTGIGPATVAKLAANCTATPVGGN